MSKPVTLTFTWTPGAQPVLNGKATVKRLDFGVGGGDWADTALIPNEVAVSTKVVLRRRRSKLRPQSRIERAGSPLLIAGSNDGSGQRSLSAADSKAARIAYGQRLSRRMREPGAQRRPQSPLDVERPVQLDAAALVAQHRHAHAVARLQRLVAVDEHAFELRRARRGQHLQRQVAQMAVVALEERQRGCDGGVESSSAVRHGMAGPARRGA